jgi:signal transduction histidine kinase
MLVLGAMALIYSIGLMGRLIKEMMDKRIKFSVLFQNGLNVVFLFMFILIGLLSFNHQHEVMETTTAILCMGGGFYVLLTSFMTKNRLLQLFEINTTLEKRVEERTVKLAESHQILEENLKALKSSQDQITFQNEMATYGKLAGQIAHEMNSSLGGIYLTTQSLLRNLESEASTKQVPVDHQQSSQKTPQINSQLVKGITRIQKAAEKMSEVVETLKRLYGTHSRTLGLIEFKPFFTDMMTLIKEDLDREGINLKIDDHSGPDSTLWGKAQEINYAVSTILRYIITLAKYSPTKEIDLVILDAYNQVAISIQSNVFYESLNPFNEILNLSIINKILEANGGSVDFSRAQTSGLVSLYLPRAAGVSSASG